MYVEFGTGPVGKNNPYPGNNHGWKYDVGENIKEYSINGVKVVGWFYPDESGGYRFTKGMPSRPFMYESALESTGITKGHVIVTSPVSATGESALAGIMSAYEYATNTEIPEEVKEAANEEIYTTSEIVNNSNVSADDLTDVVDEVKEEVEAQNITNHETIVNIINDVTVNNNIILSSEDIESLAESIRQTQLVQDQASDYQSQINNFVQEQTGGFSLDTVFNF